MQQRKEQPKYTIETITPARARQLIDGNERNRAVKLKRVDTYSRNMQNGDWVENGDAIRVDWNGVLLDGQHRLFACIQTNMAFRTLVVTNLDPKAMETIDRGAPRTASDDFRINGVKNAAKVASTIKCMGLIACGTEYRVMDSMEVGQVLMNHPQIEDSIIHTNIQGMGAVKIPLCAVLAISKIIGIEAVGQKFVSVFTTLTPSYVGDPAHVLAMKLIRYHATNRAVTASEMRLMITSAFEAFRAKKAHKRYRQPEGVPSIEGWDQTVMGLQRDAAPFTRKKEKSFSKPEVPAPQAEHTAV